MLKNNEVIIFCDKVKLAFFTAFLALFLIPYLSYEMSGSMTLEARLVFLGMIALLAFGWISSFIRTMASRDKDRSYGRSATLASAS